MELHLISFFDSSLDYFHEFDHETAVSSIFGVLFHTDKGSIRLEAANYLHQDQLFEKEPKFCQIILSNETKVNKASEGWLRRWKTFYIISVN